MQTEVLVLNDKNYVLIVLMYVQSTTVSMRCRKHFSKHIAHAYGHWFVHLLLRPSVYPSVLFCPTRYLRQFKACYFLTLYRNTVQKVGEAKPRGHQSKISQKI